MPMCFKRVCAVITFLILVAFTCRSQDNRAEVDFRADYNVVETWRPGLYLKTNAVGLGIAVANMAAEVDLAKRWSLSVPVYYSAWNYFKPTMKFRTLALQPEIRFWCSDNSGCNDGWFTGVHFGLAWYNVAFDGDFRTQDHGGHSPALGGGVATGYRLPVSRRGRWRLEFSIGAGAYRLHYDKFRNVRDGLLYETGRKIWYGVDQANVSIVYAFNIGRKGGQGR